MFPSRAVLASVALLGLAGPARRDEIAFRVAADTKLVRTVKSEYAMQLDSMTLSMDGEEVPMEEFGAVDIQIGHSETCVVTDAFEAVADGRPRRLRRTFDELGGKDSSSFSSTDGEQSDDSDSESALEGKTVVFTWDDEAASFAATFAEGQDGDEALLAELDEDMDLRRLLPTGPISAGDSWSIDAGAFECVLDPGGDLGLEQKGGEKADTSAQDAELRANLAGTIKATYKGTVAEAGIKLALIVLEIDTNTHAEEPLGPEEVPEGTSGSGRIEVHFQLEGELRWDLEHGHALSFDLSGENELKTTQTITGEWEGESLEHVQTMVFSGQTTFSLRVERQ